MVPVTATFLFNPKVWLLETVTLSRIKSPFSTTSVAASAVSSVTTGASSSAENASAVSSAGVSVTTGTSCHALLCVFNLCHDYSSPLGGGQIDFVEKNCFEQSNIEIKVKMK